MANVELLEKVMTYIEDHPETHDQSAWGVAGRKAGIHAPVCGTAFCFAGHASVTFAGDTPVWMLKSQRLYHPEADRYVQNTYQAFDYVRTADGRNVYVGTRAKDLLDLVEGEADALFDGCNSRKRLRVLVDRLIAGETIDEYDDTSDDER